MSNIGVISYKCPRLSKKFGVSISVDYAYLIEEESQLTIFTPCLEYISACEGSDEEYGSCGIGGNGNLALGRDICLLHTESKKILEEVVKSGSEH